MCYDRAEVGLFFVFIFFNSFLKCFVSHCKKWPYRFKDKLAWIFLFRSVQLQMFTVSN